MNGTTIEFYLKIKSQKISTDKISIDPSQCSQEEYIEIEKKYKGKK